MEAQHVTHCTLLCISVSFQVGEEFGVGCGVEGISCTFESLCQRNQDGEGKSLRLGPRGSRVLGWALTLSCSLASNSHIGCSHSTQQFSGPVVQTTTAVGKDYHFWSACKTQFSVSWAFKLSGQIQLIQGSPLELPTGTNFHGLWGGGWMLMDTRFIYRVMKVCKLYCSDDYAALWIH